MPLGAIGQATKRRVHHHHVEHLICLAATDDESFTYNKRISRLATIQEHKMILRAVERGVSEARIAAALNVNIALIRQKRTLLSLLRQIRQVVNTKTHVLNLLHRLIDGKVVDGPPLDTPQALALHREPKANVERYDGLRAQIVGGRDAS